MTQIGVFDKDNASLDDVFLGAEAAGLTIEECSASQRSTLLHTYPIVITHIKDVDSDESNDWQELLDKSASGTVRLRVSNVGRKQDPRPYIRNGVYVFSLVKKSWRLESQDWKKVLQGLAQPATREALIQGRNDQDLMQYFVEHYQPSIQILPSLSVRASTYLALCDQPISADQLHPTQIQWWRTLSDVPNFLAAVEEERKALKIDETDLHWPDVMSLIQAIKADEVIEKEKVIKARQALVGIFTAQK